MYVHGQGAKEPPPSNLPILKKKYELLLEERRRAKQPDRSMPGSVSSSGGSGSACHVGAKGPMSAGSNIASPASAPTLAHQHSSGHPHTPAGGPLSAEPCVGFVAGTPTGHPTQNAQLGGQRVAENAQLGGQRVAENAQLGGQRVAEQEGPYRAEHGAAAQMGAEQMGASSALENMNMNMSGGRMNAMNGSCALQTPNGVVLGDVSLGRGTPMMQMGGENMCAQGQPGMPFAAGCPPIYQQQQQQQQSHPGGIGTHMLPSMSMQMQMQMQNEMLPGISGGPDIPLMGACIDPCMNMNAANPAQNALLSQFAPGLSRLKIYCYLEINTYAFILHSSLLLFPNCATSARFFKN